jgi:hypothetical protein
VDAPKLFEGSSTSGEEQRRTSSRSARVAELLENTCEGTFDEAEAQRRREGEKWRDVECERGDTEKCG